MIPHWQKIGLIECPNCNWKIERTNYSCPNCGYTLPSILKNNLYADSDKDYDKTNEPNFQNLRIGTPTKYIDDAYKKELKNSNIFLKLILNFNQFNFTSDFLNDNFDRIVEKANSNFINREKRNKAAEFRNEINSKHKFFTAEDKKIFKDKYNTEYCDYFKLLNLNKSIEIANRNFIKNEKKRVLREFQNDLDNYNGFITENDMKKLSEKYDKGYYNYFYSLNFASVIKEKNEKAINQEKEIVLNDFNEKLNKSNKVISDSDREKFKMDYNKEYFNFYDELGLDQVIDDFNVNYIHKSKRLNTKGYFSQHDNYEFSIDDVISKIDCDFFKGEPSEIKLLIRDLEEYIDSSIIDIILTDLEDEERSKLIIKIRDDISNEKILGNIDDIIDFYYEQYMSIKKQFNLNNFLNDYIKSDDFLKFVKLYDSYSDELIFGIIEHVRNDISEDESIDEDKIILKIDYYFKVESTKINYFLQIDKIRDNSVYYISKYNLTDDEFEDILNFIQTKITEGYHIKNLKICLTNQIMEKVDTNRNESRLRLKRLLSNQKFIEDNNISDYKKDKISDDVGNLIYENKVRSSEINEEFLLKRLRRIDYGIY